MKRRRSFKDLLQQSNFKTQNKTEIVLLRVRILFLSFKGCGITNNNNLVYFERQNSACKKVCPGKEGGGGGGGEGGGGGGKTQ